MVDVIGVVRDVSLMKPVKFKDGSDVWKKTFKLYDETGQKVEVTVWREIAAMEIKDNQILALKNMRVSVYNNMKELCATLDTMLMSKVKSSKVSKLKTWALNNPPEICRTKVIPKHRYKIMVLLEIGGSEE